MANNAGGAPQPPSIEKRLPIALALMMLVLLGSQLLFKPAPQPKPAQPVSEKTAVKSVVQPAPAAATEATNTATPAPAAAGRIEAAAEVTNTIETNFYRIDFTNRGAVVKSWILKQYKDDTGKPLQLVGQAVLPEQTTHVPLPFAIETRDQKLPFDPNSVLYQVKLSPERTGVEYEYSDGATTIRKSFHFDQQSYLSEIKSSVLAGNTPVPHFLEWRGGFGDPKAFRAASTQRTVRYDATAGKLVTKNSKDAKNGPVTDSGDYTFAGVEDNFFAAVALPKNNSALEIRIYSDDIKTPGEEKPVPYIGAGLAMGAQNDLTLFVGPKDVDMLKKINPKLAQLVDWGFFGILAKPIFVWLNWVHDHWTNNYGWAIIAVTLIINVVLFPLRISSLKSARKMQALQPQIKAINERYKNISMRDPRKAEQNQEVMALYKKEGVNPVGGCLPMLIQLPFLYAFYRVLSISIDLRHAPWLWVKDLSAPETLAIHVLPIILVATQFLSQKMTPAAGVDPNQQRMMMIMPLMFGFMFYYLSSGLVLYYLTSNLVGIGQQLIINRVMPPPTPPEPPPKAPVRKTVKK